MAVMIYMDLMPKVHVYFHPEMTADDPFPGDSIVFAGEGHVIPERRVPAALWEAMLAEFERNGRKALTAADVMRLREQVECYYGA